MSLQLSAGPYVDFGAACRPTGALTVCGWCRVGNPALVNTVLHCTNSGTPLGYFFSVRPNSGSYQKAFAGLVRSADGAAYYQRIGSTDVTTGAYFHLAATFQASTSAPEMRLYVNGNEETYQYQVPGAFAGIGYSAALQMGYYSGYGAAHIELFDLRVYNRPLGAAEVKSIAEGHGSDGITGGLLARWLLNEGPGGQPCASVPDYSGNAVTGTPQNGAPVYAAAPLRVY